MLRYILYVLACVISLPAALALVIQMIGILFPKTLAFYLPAGEKAAALFSWEAALVKKQVPADPSARENAEPEPVYQLFRRQARN